MDLPRQPTGGIFQDLASFAIFFALREAQFSTFSFGRAKQKAASHSTLTEMALGWCNALKGTENGLFGYPNAPCIFYRAYEAYILTKLWHLQKVIQDGAVIQDGHSPFLTK